jgi:hypothetical protein
MTPEQKEFAAICRDALTGALPQHTPYLCGLRDTDFDEALEMLIRFALTNSITPSAALAHVDSAIEGY